jgi:hypothetical protein
MSTRPPARDPEPSPVVRLNNAAMELNHDHPDAEPVFHNDADGTRLEVRLPGVEAVPAVVLSVAGRYELSCPDVSERDDGMVATFI